MLIIFLLRIFVGHSWKTNIQQRNVKCNYISSICAILNKIKTNDGTVRSQHKNRTVKLHGLRKFIIILEYKLRFRHRCGNIHKDLNP